MASRIGTGLTQIEAETALRRHGPNLIAPRYAPPAFVVWAIRIITDPMALLLIVAAAVYTAVGDRTDAIVSAIALLPIVAVGVVLEGRADSALAKLREMSAPRAVVVRDGIEREIRAEDVVPGDLLVVREGDIVAADANLIDGRVAIDESALSGESIPVDHVPDEIPEIAAGTTVTGGRGKALVTKTGSTTRYGRIALLLRGIHPPRTPIERTIRSLVTRLGLAVLLVCAAVVFVERGHGASWSIALIAAVSLGMAAIPEELPMVYTLYLALGAWRLSRDNALVRRLASVETLGSTTTICVDKTGTLTYGRVEIAEIVPLNGAARDDLLATGVLASDIHGGDPLDAAFARAVPDDPRNAATLLDDVPYEARRRYAAKRWRTGEDEIYAVKGAFEVVTRLVSGEDVPAQARAENERLAAEGMRVLAIARSRGDESLCLLGLVAFRDPLRPDAPAALAQCRSASVRVVMITGDHPATASAIARDAGFGDDATRVVTGDQLAATPEEELPELINGARVFARTHPEQKLLIVRTLRALGETVAMTGDGTNDALALKEADIGIAMGERGTEVAREAAALVLLDDDVSTIVRAIRDGRRIFDNLRRAFGYLVGFHAPLLVPAVVLPVLGFPLLLEPVHLVWLELIVHPTSSLVFEGDDADRDVMSRPPRARTEGLLRRIDWVRATMLGLTLALVVVAIDVWALNAGLPTNVARATALVTMLVGQTMLIFVQRSPNRPFWSGAAPTPVAWALAGGALVSLALGIEVPPLAALLHVAAPPIPIALAAAVAGAVSTVWWEPFKR
jgi:Ca2+-transporting ATPase